MRKLVFLILVIMLIGSCYNKKQIVDALKDIDKNKSTLTIIQEKKELGELSSSNLEGEALKDAFFEIVDSIVLRENNERQANLPHEIMKYEYVQIVETHASSNEGFITREEAKAEKKAILDAAFQYSETSTGESD